jgi:hypothetical protein
MGILPGQRWGAEYLSSGSEVVNASRRWVLPYREIAERLEKGSRARVILSSDGEATDLVFWARSRGYKIVRHVRTAAGIEVVLEAPKREAPPRPAAPAGAVPTRRPVAEAAPAASVSRPEAPAAARAPEATLDIVSRRMADPLFRVDLLLVATSLRSGVLEGPTSIDALARIASEAAGRGCAHLEATHSSGARLEMLTCGMNVEGIILHKPEGGVLEGREAVKEAAGILREGRLEYRIMSVDKSFIEKLKS